MATTVACPGGKASQEKEGKGKWKPLSHSAVSDGNEVGRPGELGLFGDRKKKTKAAGSQRGCQTATFPGNNFRTDRPVSGDKSGKSWLGREKENYKTVPCAPKISVLIRFPYCDAAKRS